MTIIDRYIMRSYFGGFLILITLGIGMYVLLDVLVNADEFTKAERPLGQVLFDLLDLYGHNLPLYYAQLAGPVMAVAACFTIAGMLRNNELVPLISAGVPLQRLLVPVMAVTLGLVGVWLLDREMLIPSWADKIARTRDDILTTRVQGVECARDDNNAILTAQGLYPREKRLYRAIFVDPQTEGKLPTLVQADAATWDEARHVWSLQRGRRISVAPGKEEGLGESIRYEPLDEYPYSLSPEQLVLRRDAQWADLMSLSQLRLLLESRLLPNRAALEKSFHVRVTQPLIQIMLVLLAVPAFLQRSPVNILSRGALALLIAGSFFAASFLSQALLHDSELAAFFAWLPILVFGPWAAARMTGIPT